MYILILELGGSRPRLVDMSSAHQAVVASGPTYLDRRRVCSLGVEVVDAIWSLELERTARSVSVNDAAVRPAKVWGKRELWTVGLRKWQWLFNGTGSDSSVGQVPLRRSRRTTKPPTKM